MQFSPYLFAWGRGSGEYRASSLEDCARLGIKCVTLGFLVSDRVEEILDWCDEVEKYRGIVDVRLSIGGACGWIKEENESCLVAAERVVMVLKRLGILKIDLDIEGSILENNCKICELITIMESVLRQFDEELDITLTLPVEFDHGLNNCAIYTINKFLDSNVRISIINLMLMDFYTPLAKHVQWYEKHIQIIRYVYENQLSNLGFTWENIGICPMIGENDDNTKFTLHDWDKVLDYVIDKKIGLITFWAVNRDQKKHWSQHSHKIDTHSRCQDVDYAYTKAVLNKISK